MKAVSLSCVAIALLTVGFGLSIPLPAAAQIKQMSNRELRAETNRAARQARRISRKAQQDDPSAGSFLDMSVYNMKPNQAGRKAIKANDGRANYEFTRAGEPMVTATPALTAKRLKRKK